MTQHRFKLMAAAAAATMTIAGAADAGVTYFSYGLGAPAQTLITNFSSDTAGTGPTHLPASLSWSGAGTVLDTTSALGAEPGVAGGVHQTGNYLSITGNKSETLKLPDATSLGVYIGSLDGYNSISFGLKNGTTMTFTGAQLGAVSGSADGDQLSGDTNGLFDFSFGSPIDSVTFNSGKNSFEISSISGAFSLVPEPSSWALLGLGVAMLGFALRSSRRGDAAVAVG